MPAHIDDLKNWDDMNRATRRNILIGNGLSIGVSKIFAYPSLKRIAAVVRNKLNATDRRIFEEFDTSDFELVLRRLREASRLNMIVRQSRASRELEFRYRRVRRALVDAISHIHPEYNAINHDWLTGSHRALSEYGKVFTTNYDFILYWIIAVNFWAFNDFFRDNNGSLEFRLSTVSSLYNRTEVYYLHGALFMFNVNDVMQKLKRSPAVALPELVYAYINDMDRVPTFVAEGNYIEKRVAINRNEYLLFALSSFSQISVGLTIYGQSLNTDSDKHLVDAINQNERLQCLAISIHTKLDDIDGHLAQMNSYLAKFKPFRDRGGVIEFFGHESTPLNYERYGVPF